MELQQLINSSAQQELTQEPEPDQDSYLTVTLVLSVTTVKLELQPQYQPLKDITFHTWELLLQRQLKPAHQDTHVLELETTITKDSPVVKDTTAHQEVLALLPTLVQLVPTLIEQTCGMKANVLSAQPVLTVLLDQILQVG